MPSTVAMASASRGFLHGGSTARAVLLFIVMRFVEIEEDGLAFGFDTFFFVKDGVGNDVLLAGPVAKILHSAALTAKRKLRMHRRIGLRLANGASVFHGERFFFSAPSVSSVLRNPQNTVRRPKPCALTWNHSSIGKYSLPQHAQRCAGGNAMQFFSGRNRQSSRDAIVNTSRGPRQNFHHA